MIATLFGVALSAQQPPLFRAATRLVYVSVVVEGRDGRPVADLKSSDFRLFDGGQEQRIELFMADADANDAAASSTTSAVTGASAPLEFSNRFTSRRGATVVLFDRLNMPAADQIYAREQFLSFLKQIKTEDRVGIYVLEPEGIRVLHDFTNDARSLVRAMARYQAMTSHEPSDVLPSEPPDTGDAALDAQMMAAFERASANMTAHYNGLRSDATMAAFLAIANHLAGIDGRKSLIWVTAGFPLQALSDRGKNTTTEVNRVTRSLNDANIALYAVDSRGLAGALTFGAAGAVSFTTMSSVQTNQDILQIAAAETGGRAFLNTNDIHSALRRAQDEGRVTYTLGYYPSHGKWDGTYRSIEIKLTRPGVQVRHRRGYLAATGTARVSPSAAIRAALASPLEASGLPFTARIERLPASSDLKISVALPAGVVRFEREGEMWKGELDLAVGQKLADGTASRSVDQTFDLRLRQDRYEEALTRGFTIDTRVTLLPKVQTLHVVVHDERSGITGSVVVHADKLQTLLQ